MNNKQENEMTFVEKLKNAPSRIKRIICTRQFWVELVVMTAGMRPLQNSLFKIRSFHHIFVPL